MTRLNFKLITLTISLLICNQLDLFSQCAAGPYSVDPASAEALECNIVISSVSSACDDLELSASSDETLLTIPSGTQVCFELPNTASFIFQTCSMTTDDTFITIFDEFGNPLDWNDDNCGVQSALVFEGTQGVILCAQVESAVLGVCEGINSTSPSYDLLVTCFSEVIDNFEPTFIEPTQCQSPGFNAIETQTDDTGLFNRMPFVFNTGATNSNNEAYTTGSLTICVQGDLGGLEEIWQIRDENGACLGGLGNFEGTDIVFDGNCTTTPACTSFNFDSSEVDAFVSDGVVSFQAFEFGEIGAFCDSNFVSMELTLCTDNIIPTMGEWGLICLTITLLIFGIVAIRQKQLITA